MECDLKFIIDIIKSTTWFELLFTSHLHSFRDLQYDCIALQMMSIFVTQILPLLLYYIHLV